MSISKSEKEFIHALVEMIGEDVKHPVAHELCKLCVTFDEFDKLPRFFFSKQHIKTDESDPESDPEASETDPEASETDPDETESYESDTKVGGKHYDDLEVNSDSESSYQSEKPIKNTTKKVNIKVKEPVTPTATKTPTTPNLSKPPVTPPVFATEVQEMTPTFIKYGDDAWIYKTLSGEYIKLIGDKYHSKTISQLDVIADKMFVKTFGNDYKNHVEYKNMQSRYAAI